MASESLVVWRKFFFVHQGDIHRRRNTVPEVLAQNIGPEIINKLNITHIDKKNQDDQRTKKSGHENKAGEKKHKKKDYERETWWWKTADQRETDGESEFLL